MPFRFYNPCGDEIIHALQALDYKAARATALTFPEDIGKIEEISIAGEATDVSAQFAETLVQSAVRDEQNPRRWPLVAAHVDPSLIRDMERDRDRRKAETADTDAAEGRWLNSQLGVRLP